MGRREEANAINAKRTKYLIPPNIKTTTAVPQADRFVIPDPATSIIFGYHSMSVCSQRLKYEPAPHTHSLDITRCRSHEQHNN